MYFHCVLHKVLSGIEDTIRASNFICVAFEISFVSIHIRLTIYSRRQSGVHKITEVKDCALLFAAPRGRHAAQNGREGGRLGHGRRLKAMAQPQRAR
eukprot:483236-Pleurochrysis_carterae.AAC.1